MKMKREYTKPVVELVKFEMSEAIASCDVKIYVSPVKDTEGCKLNTVFEDINFFEAADNCADDRWPEKYCYYTPDGLATFNS